MYKSCCIICFVGNRISYEASLGTETKICSDAGLPRSGKYIWKMTFFPGQGKVKEFCGWPGKFREDLEDQGKVREFENKWLRQSSK